MLAIVVMLYTYTLFTFWAPADGGVDQNAYLVDVADKILIYGPDARAAVREENDKALSTQKLQGLAHRVGRGAVTPGEVGDHKPFVGR